MENQIKELKIKVNRLEQLGNELEKRISEQEKNSDKNWLSTLDTCRAEIDAIKESVEFLFKINSELAEKEPLIYKTGSLKKTKKFEKKKKKLSNSIFGLGKILETFEDNLRITISKL